MIIRKLHVGGVSVSTVSQTHSSLPVVPPPGAVSADITPGYRADLKSKPYL